jgi:hypothetical protein
MKIISHVINVDLTLNSQVFSNIGITTVLHIKPCVFHIIRIFGNIFEFEQTCTISIIIHVTIGEPTTTCCIQLPQNTSKYNTSVHDGLDEIIQLIGYLQRAPHILGMQIQLALSPLEMPNHHNLQQLVWHRSVKKQVSTDNFSIDKLAQITWCCGSKSMCESMRTFSFTSQKLRTSRSPLL